MQRRPDARGDVYFVLTSFAHVVIAVLFGVLLNPAQFPALLILAFAITSKAFALFAGENERFFVHLRWASLPLAATSVVIMLFLPPVDILFGSVVLLLYLNYPLLMRARERSPLDVLFHGLRYALLFWLGYGSTPTLASATAISVVFLFGVTGELLVGLRNQGGWRTTASLLGTASTVRIVNVFTFLLVILGSLLFSQEIDFPLVVGAVSVPIPLLIGVVLGAFLVRPVSRGRSSHAPLSVRRRELVAIALVGFALIATPVVTRVGFEQMAPAGDYTVTVGMQTFVTGPDPWDGQWIVFDYQNPRNFYYVLMHTDGTLELSRYANSTVPTHLDNIKTGLSPFVWHSFEIAVAGGELSVSVDGKEYITSQIGHAQGEVMISQLFPRLNLWVVRVTSLQVVATS